MARQEDDTEAKDEDTTTKTQGATVLIQEIQYDPDAPVGDEPVDQITKRCPEPYEHAITASTSCRLSQTE